MVGWGAGCGDPLGWREAAGCCITDAEEAACGPSSEDYVESQKELIRRSGWDTERDAVRWQQSGDNCLAGLIRLENATEGLYKKHYTNGRLRYQVNYIAGKREGKFVRYYKNRKVHEEGNYTDGKLDGKWVYYDPEGKILDEDIWDYGECVEMCEGDE